MKHSILVDRWQQTPFPQTAHSFAYTILRTNRITKCHRFLDHRGVLSNRERESQRIRSYRFALYGRRRDALTVEAPRPERLIAVKRHDDRGNAGSHSGSRCAGAAVMYCRRHPRK